MNATETLSAREAYQLRHSGSFDIQDAREALIDAAKKFDQAEEPAVHRLVLGAITAVDDAMAAVSEREQARMTTAERIAFERRMEKGE